MRISWKISKTNECRYMFCVIYVAAFHLQSSYFISISRWDFKDKPLEVQSREGQCNEYGIPYVLWFSAKYIIKHLDEIDLHYADENKYVEEFVFVIAKAHDMPHVLNLNPPFTTSSEAVHALTHYVQYLPTGILPQRPKDVIAQLPTHGTMVTVFIHVLRELSDLKLKFIVFVLHLMHEINAHKDKNKCEPETIGNLLAQALFKL